MKSSKTMHNSAIMVMVRTMTTTVMTLMHEEDDGRGWLWEYRSVIIFIAAWSA